MNDTTSTAVPKTHPATREILPDDPLEMHSFEIPGDTDLMLRLLVEEYARIGWGVEPIMALARDPNYLAFHGLWRLYGEHRLRNRVREIVARCGIARVRTVEAHIEPEQLVQLEMPT
jgi:hypothetical protein